MFKEKMQKIVSDIDFKNWNFVNLGRKYEIRVRAQISFHIPLYDKGEYHDLEADEKELVDKGVAYIKAKVALIPVNQLKKVED